MIKIELEAGLFFPTHLTSEVVQIRESVVLNLGDGKIEFSTIAAHKLGFALIYKEQEALENDFVVMTINEVKVNLLPRDAKQIGAKLLICCDDADRFQRNLQ